MGERLSARAGLGTAEVVLILAGLCASSPAQIRLVNGPDPCTGRLEVFYNGTWGTVCDDHWSLAEARVVCRQLGCGMGLSAVGGARYGRGEDPIWLDNVQCSGTEAALSECRARPWGDHNCGHGEDVSIVCSEPPEVRLVNSSNRCSGRVEVLHNQQWGSVCDDDWDLDDAQVVCRQLGCGTAILAPHAAQFGLGNDPIWLDDVNCAGSEAALSECRARPWGENNCNHREAASVVCAEPAQLRLVNGSSRCSGRVEVLRNQQWGTVCDDGWDLRDAEVVCRQLGCGMAMSAPGSAEFGQGSSHIWLQGVECTGTEAALSKCRARPEGVHLCHHGEDAGVVCSEPPEVRLVNSSNRCSGRVEVLHNQQWGSVCDDDWDLDDAQVVCRQLGCGTAILALHAAQFGLGNDPIWLDDVNCAGSEAALSECRARPWGENNCNHREAASVVCAEPAQLRLMNGFQLRLVNGSSRCSGRVEVLRNQQWGTVCDDDWDLRDAEVVCRQLGCGMAVSAPGSAEFGQGSSHIWLQGVECTGTEAALSKCRARPEGVHLCHHGEDAGVVCSEPPEVRLVNGSNRCSGRVEVLHNQQWGSVCDDDWDLDDAQVVCRQLGCGTAIWAPHAAQFGLGNDPIWLDDVNCTGSEAALSECRARPWGENNCNHREAASVVCAEPAQLRLMNGFQLRLVNGSSRCSGRVEVLRNQQWGTVCDDDWDLRDAEVVCRQLGCGMAVSAPGSAEFGQGSSHIWLQGVECTGTEAALSKCRARPEGVHLCHHGEDAGVVCSDPPEVRLVNGSNRCSGRVEVLHNQQWGSVCDDDWDLDDAQVVCRQLGCGTAILALHAAQFGLGNDPIWLDDVNCAGSEAALSECRARPWGENNCNHREAASVVCAEPAQLRLVNGSSRCSGRVEVLRNQQWGTVCDDDWDLRDAEVVCRQLGCGMAVSAPGSAEFGQGSSHIWLQGVECTGTEAALSKCRARPEGVHLCHHGEDAGVVCSDPPEVRLVNGSNRCSGRVEVLHNQQWGSVCDDDWDLDDAQVVCRQLGCGTAIWAPHAAQFGLGNDPIWLDDVNCAGSEAALSECRARPWGENNCNHREAASVVCAEPAQLRLMNGFQLRLVNGSSRCSGRVEVLRNQQWGTVCDDDWDLRDAEVVCRQLGCGMAVSAPGSAEFGQGSSHIWLQGVECTGTEAALSKCRARPEGVHLCHHGEDAGVVCSDPPEVRLVNGSNRCSGRVEVLHNQQWGSVCDDDWDLDDAQVVCRQLGCGTAILALHAAQFGLGNDPIWLDDVNCAGSEAALSECRARPWGENNCNHREAASVVCAGKPPSFLHHRITEFLGCKRPQDHRVQPLS
ncbi:scavenger receptor cysteine-rich domain-containing protein DMBT1-like [Anas platyrhynchos]|uniref:scavenger receptor cysteine-rich domain-containing protein DMBT1-like n=1 Tax=Anas platyrhynchos TaxID=8839 RepID=UPI003AF26703